MASLLPAVILLLTFSAASAVDDKCAACNAVAAELEIGLSNVRFLLKCVCEYICRILSYVALKKKANEKRHGRSNLVNLCLLLDSNWLTFENCGLCFNRVSELRVVELLDGLCDKMQSYTLEKIDSSRREWIKVNDWDTLTTNKQEARAYSKQMSSYCGRLLEETEDELTELIKKGSVTVGGVSKVLCQDLSKHCRSSGSHQADVDVDDEHEEL
ncbi:unnamed protein product [Linum tenue]|uniref:DUF3456 domain-containing protein n=1 Tax=Linum tenue TaxID=586396 RepID=A0AAV0H9G1_9ROSI|nr:unnamed protein product [Linum tenue]